MRDDRLNLKLFKSKKINLFNVIVALCPFNINTQITPKNHINILSRIELVLTLSLRALEAFCAGHLKDFDAHVGETSCQIRAFALIYLTQETGVYCTAQIKEIRTIIQGVSQLKEQTVFSATKLQNYIDTYFPKEKIQIPVLYLSACYILSQYTLCDNELLPQQIDSSTFEADFKESKKFIKKLMHSLQIYISRESCLLMINIAKKLNFSRYSLEDLNRSIKRGDENRYVMPAFTSMYLIEQYFQQMDFIISLRTRVNNDNLHLFLRNHKGHIKVLNDTPQKTLPCFCVYGTSQFQGSLENFQEKILHTLTHSRLCLLSLSIHPQYPGKTLAQKNTLFTYYPHLYLPQEIQKSFDFNVLFGRQLGCSKQYNDLFIAKHIYTNSVENELQLMEKLTHSLDSKP